jgi:hypothetical protein
MSDDGRWMSLPTGRKLQGPDSDPRYQGSVGPLRRPDADMLKLARRSLREISEEEIEGQTAPCREDERRGVGCGHLVRRPD